MKKSVKFLLVTFMFLYLFNLSWRNSAKPFGEKVYSEDGRYYGQRYEVFTWNKLMMTSPGNGSDKVDGFIRLYDAKTDELLREKFVTFLVAYELHWSDGALYTLGNDGVYWEVE